MAQPQRNVDVSAGVDDVCPECHSAKTVITIESDNCVVYCRYLDCGLVWDLQDPPPH